jgi:hypothetical protein
LGGAAGTYSQIKRQKEGEGEGKKQKGGGRGKRKMKKGEKNLIILPLS